MSGEYVKIDHMGADAAMWEEYVTELDRELADMTVADLAEEIMAGSYIEYVGKLEAEDLHAPEEFLEGNPDKSFVLNRMDCDHFKRAAALAKGEQRDQLLMDVMERLMAEHAFLHCLEALDEAENAIVQWSDDEGLSQNMKQWQAKAKKGEFLHADGSPAAQVQYRTNGSLCGTQTLENGSSLAFEDEVIWDIDSNLSGAMAYRWFGSAGSNQMSPEEAFREMKFYFGWKVRLADLDKMQDQNGRAIRGMDLTPYESHISRVTLDCGKSVFGANVWFRQGAELKKWVNEAIDTMLKEGYLVLADHCLGLAISILETRTDRDRHEGLLKEWRNWFMQMDDGTFMMSGGRNLGELHFYRAGNGVMIYDKQLTRKGRWCEIPEEEQ